MAGESEPNSPLGKRDWRYYLGLFLFVLSLILPLLALVIVPTLGVTPGISATLYALSVAGGPDVMLIAAAALMGKENLQHLFSSLGSWFKNLVKWDQVSHRRYKIGLWLMCLSIAATVVLFYFFTNSLLVGNHPGWGFYVTIAADIVFIISFFVLGAGFWAKIRALFQHNVHVVMKD